MINWQSIISVFNEKGTLLQWLKKVEVALKTSVLQSVSVTTSAGAAVFSFNFADGTKIDTPPVNLPRGPEGVPGISIKTIKAGESYEDNEYTVTPITITYSDNTTEKLTIKAQRGEYAAQGLPGNGIADIKTVDSYQQGEEVITVIEVETTNGDNPRFEIRAQNPVGETLYTHIVSVGNIPSFSHTVYLAINNTNEEPISDLSGVMDALNLILKPTQGYNTKSYPIASSDGTAGVIYIGENGALIVNINGITFSLSTLATYNDTVSKLIQAGKNGNGIVTIHTVQHYEEDGETINVIEVVTDDENLTFEVHAANGAAGRGVTAFGSGDPTTDSGHPGYTATPVTAVYTDGSAPSSFKVYAKDGNSVLYNHLVTLTRGDLRVNLNIISTKADAYDLVNLKTWLYNIGARNSPGYPVVGSSYRSAHVDRSNNILLDADDGTQAIISSDATISDVITIL